jgi:beta-lactamase superfamily II metal-dependent hydrolase
MKSTLAALAAMTICLPIAQAQTGAKPFDMYFVDTEGGLSALYVSPSGETMLLDTGNPGDRDLNRILDVLKDAGVKQIDYMVITHYHIDHVGSYQALYEKIPMKHFVDHGVDRDTREHIKGFYAWYTAMTAKAGPGARMIAKPGDIIPIKGLKVEVLTADGKVLKKPIAGAPGAGKPNPACASYKKQPPNTDLDNAASLALVFQYGKFRTINMGDFVYDEEGDLMCPNNPIGTIDLYLTAHHSTDQSGSAALVHALRPRVTVMTNGQRKGGAAPVYQVLHTSPGMEDIWQLHYSLPGGLENNAPGVFIANVEDPKALGSYLENPPAPRVPGAARGPRGASGRGGQGRGFSGPITPHNSGPAYYIKVSAMPDGSFTVTNTRNNFSKTYAAKK